jgi:hypothetical protein
MIVKKGEEIPAIRGRCDTKTLPLESTPDGVLKVHQTNNPQVAEKVRVVNATLPVRVVHPLEIEPIEGTVSINNAINVDGSIEVSNFPEKVLVQEGLTVVPLTKELKIVHINSTGFKHELLRCPSKVCAIHFTFRGWHHKEKTEYEIELVTGTMYDDHFDLDLTPHYFKCKKLILNTQEHVSVGGYIVYED